jgi:SAM-dependent methyltransferase
MSSTPPVRRTIAILDDFLRDEPNGLAHHVANRRWLAAMVRSLAGEACVPRELGFDLAGEAHLDVPAFMAALGLDCGVAGWAAAWEREPTDRFVALLGARLRGADAVAGFGLSNVVATAVERLGLPFIDVEVSPFRFQPDLDIDARTNVPALAGSSLFAVPEPRLRAAATAVRGWCARHAPDVIPAGVGRVGVVFGQTEVDASLVDAGQLGDFATHAETVREWAEGLDHVLFRPHPYAATAAAFELLSAILPTIRPTRIGSYALLASDRVERFLAVSSGIIDEAIYFDAAARSTRLFPPKRRTGGFPYSPVASLEVLSAAVLEAVVAGRPIPAGTGQSYALRQQFAIAWGLPLEATASDFYTPAPIAVPQPESEPAGPVAPKPDGPTLPEPPPAEPAAAEAAPIPPPDEPRTNRLPLPRKVAREAARLVAQARRLLGVSDRHAAAALSAEPPPEPCPPAGAEPAEPAKDFSYSSGERQTGLHYFEIRRDHRARYELAARIMPRGCRVLDLFCGNGYGSFLLSDRRAVIGIDGSAEAIAVARRHYARLGARFEARQFPFEDDTRYDAVVSYESLEHVDDGVGFVRFLVDRVVPGGLLLFSTPNQDLLPFDPAVHVHHMRHYGLAETLALAEAEGLAVRTWFGQDVYRLDGPVPVPLHPAEMELREREPGQFTIVVAEKSHA